MPGSYWNKGVYARASLLSHFPAQRCPVALPRLPCSARRLRSSIGESEHNSLVSDKGNDVHVGDKIEGRKWRAKLKARFNGAPAHGMEEFREPCLQIGGNHR